MNFDTIQYAVDDPNATTALNRPDRLNALTGPMLAELQQAVAEAERDERVVAEHGVSWMLPRLVGPARAMDLLLSSRKFDGAEAERLGVVNRMVAHDRLLDHTREYLTQMATHSAPTSLQIMKHQVYKHLDVPLGDALRESLALMERSLRHPDFTEGVASYLEKRPPRLGRVSVPARPTEASS